MWNKIREGIIIAVLAIGWVISLILFTDNREMKAQIKKNNEENARKTKLIQELLDTHKAELDKIKASYEQKYNALAKAKETTIKEFKDNPASMVTWLVDKGFEVDE